MKVSIKEKIKKNKKFIITILFINLFFIIIIDLYYYSITQNYIEDYKNQLKEQATVTDTTEIEKLNNQESLNNQIEKNVTLYVKSMVTMEENNYHPLESVEKVEKITTENFYEDLYSQYASFEENKGGSGDTGGTSSEVEIKEIYSKQISSNSYNAIVFAEETDRTNNDSSTTALLFKFVLKIENGQPLIDEIVTQQNFNYGIEGIVDKKY